MGEFAEPNGPNLNGCCFINTKGEVAGEVVIRQGSDWVALRLQHLARNDGLTRPQGTSG